jgi:AcrR family transcriptional regulator
MRYEKGHKEATRQRILETASARFRRNGIEKVGVADIMAEAGLTHGGFYSHFQSKEELVGEAVALAARQSRERFARRVQEGGLENWIRTYMRPEHRDHPEKGCAAAALASELARHPKSSRAKFAGDFQRLFAEIAEQLPHGGTPARRRARAIGIFATMMGAMQLARAAGDAALSDEILESGVANALALAEGSL